MKHWPLFFRWLTVAALLDWLIGRTITRSAIFMPKTPLMITAYQALGAIGQVAFTLTGLLALIGIIWIAWQERRNIALALLLITAAIFSFVFIFVTPDGWWAVIDRMLLVAITLLLLGRLWRVESDRRWKIVATIPLMAVWSGAMYQLLPALAQALNLPEAPKLGGMFFNAGEIFVALTPIAFWLFFRPRESTRVYVLTAIPAILYSMMHLIAPAMISMMAIWSIGLTLYLPWPIYALGLWLGTVVIINALKRDQPIGWVLLMLLAAGFAPQVSVHVFISVIALWLMLSGQTAHEAQPTTPTLQAAPHRAAIA